MANSGCLVVVDPFLSSNGFARIAKEKGLNSVAVFSSPEALTTCLPATNVPAYSAHYLNDASLGKYLAPLNVKAVLPGSDSGILTSFNLARSLGLDVGLEAPLLDRYLVSQRLGQLTHSTNFVSLSAGTPSVVKPRVSRGGIDRVHVTGSNNAFDLQSLDDEGTYFMSPMYVGTEYVLDFVSWGSRHWLAAMYRYDKYPNEPIKRCRTVLLDPSLDYELTIRLYSYGLRALDAAGVTHGATHIEVMDTAAGVQLVEVNHRCHGQLSLDSLRRSLRYSQLDLLANLSLRPSGFEPPDSRVYERRAWLIRTNLFNTRVRPFQSIDWKAIESVSSWVTTFHHYRPDSILPVSDHTIRSMIAKAVLVNEDLDKLYLDEQLVQEIFHA